MANLSHMANDGCRGELRPMTKEQYVRQNKDLRTRIENMKIARQIAEDELGLEIQELKQELRSKVNQIRLLQSHISRDNPEIIPEVHFWIASDSVDKKNGKTITLDAVDGISDVS